MPIQFTFYAFSEKTPEHQQKVVLIKRPNSTDVLEFYPVSACIEYQWEELDDPDENGDIYPTGNDFVYDEKTKDDPFFKNHCRLILLDGNGFEVDPSDLWVDEDEFFNILEGE